MEEPNNVASTVTRIGIALPPPTICRSSACPSKNVSYAVDGNTQQAVGSSETTGIASRLYFAMFRVTSSWSSSLRGGNQVLLGNLPPDEFLPSETIRRFSVTVPDRRPSSSAGRVNGLKVSSRLRRRSAYAVVWSSEQKVLQTS